METFRGRLFQVKGIIGAKALGGGGRVFQVCYEGTSEKKGLGKNEQGVRLGSNGRDKSGKAL